MVGTNKGTTARIVATPDVLFGQPRIEGTRLGVAFILDLFASGWSESEVREQYPTITREDLLAVFAFARDSVARSFRTRTVVTGNNEL